MKGYIVLQYRDIEDPMVPSDGALKIGRLVAYREQEYFCSHLGVSSWSKKSQILQFVQILHILRPLLQAHPTSIPRLGGSHAPAQHLCQSTKVCSLKCASANSPWYVPGRMCKCNQEQICTHSCIWVSHRNFLCPDIKKICWLWQWVKYRVFFYTGPPLKRLKYGKPRLGESTLT